MKTPAFSACLVLLAWSAIIIPARAADARVEVATLDGAPVYHWRAFKSPLSDGVDRALVLREFQRKHFTLPPKLVEDAVQAKITQEAGGDADKFARQLRRQGASTEEIVSSAMLYQNVPHQNAAIWAQMVQRWLAGLRVGAAVKRQDSN